MMYDFPFVRNAHMAGRRIDSPQMQCVMSYCRCTVDQVFSGAAEVSDQIWADVHIPKLLNDQGDHQENHKFLQKTSPYLQAVQSFVRPLRFEG